LENLVELLDIANIREDLARDWIWGQSGQGQCLVLLKIENSVKQIGVGQ